MYTSFFGFKENPFNLTPDPRYLFLSPYHKEALDHLLYGINERKGFIAITGGIGTGKTTLCRALLSHLDPSTKSALILNAFISDIELLKAVNHEFGLPMGQGKMSKKDYIDALNRPSRKVPGITTRTYIRNMRMLIGAIRNGEKNNLTGLQD